MNKYDGALKYTVVNTAHIWTNWELRRGRTDAIVIESQANRDLRSHGRDQRIVAWCTTKLAAEAARRLLSGECEAQP